MRHQKKLTLIVSFISLVFVLTLLPSRGKSQINSHKRHKNPDVLQTVPAQAIAIGASENPGLWIQSATAKEIIGEQFQVLTKQTAMSSRYISIPNIKLVNNTGQTIVGFSLGLLNQRSGDLEIYRKTQIRIEQGQEFIIDPMQWAGVRKKESHTFVQSGGVAQEDVSSPSWHSEGAWVPGNITDFNIFVGQIDFSDGNRWKIKRIGA
jgi:hypothetical protein